MADLAHRIIAAHRLCQCKTPCCSRLVNTDPSGRVHVSCCGKTYRVKRECVGVSLVEAGASA